MSAIIAFDFETHLIRPGLQLPPAVCMSWAEVVPPNAASVAATVGRHGVLEAKDAVAYLQCWLDNGARLIGANTAFDSLVSIVSGAKGGEEAERRILRAWVDAYEAGRVHDVFVRQKLLDLAAGCYRYEELPNGRWLTHKYNLADLAWRHRRRRLSKPEKDDQDHWRLRFGELEGLPIASYPPEAYAYALEDAIATAEVFIDQERIRFADPRIQRNFPGRDPFIDEVRQTIACVPLKAMSAYGLRTDAAAVERFAAEVQAAHEELRAELVAAGLVRPPEYERDSEAIRAHVDARGVADLFERDAAGKVKLLKASYLIAYERTADPLFWHLGNYAKLTEAGRDALVAAGLVTVKHTRDTKAAARRCVEAYAKLGRAAPRTESYDPATSGPFEHVSLDSDACAMSEDELLESYSAYTSLGKTLSNDIPMLRSGTYVPIHTRFEEILETGRTSSSKPNVQNVRRLPGIRECFVPRAGYVFIDCDFSMLELHTLAQTCYWVLGFSYLGDALRAGKDPHSQIAATILGTSYEIARGRYEAGDSAADNARTAGKGVNFGAAGGLGKATFATFAWKSYKIRMTEEEAGTLIRQYKDTWLEMPSYFAWVNSLESAPESGKYNVVQPWSGRLRANATYCAACNSPFQGLGADVAKLALWLAWKATMGLSELGERDPLFGARLVNFVHDSIMAEVLEGRAHAAAVRLKEIMDQAGAMVLGGVPVKASMVVTRQWSKKATQWREPCAVCGDLVKCDKSCPARGAWESRKLIPWDMRIACRRDLDKKLRAEPLTRDKALEYLKKKDWPTDVARETVAAVYGPEAMAA
jgi:hypothetical protein